MTALGLSASSFMCSSTGPNGTCQGATQAVQRAFIDLQTEINRVGRAFGVTKIATDGKIGPKTVAAVITVADRLGDKLRGDLDRALSDLLIEVEGSPTTARDVAGNVGAITAALKRDGAAERPWSILTAAQTAVQTILDAGAAGNQPPVAPGTPAPNPVPATTSPWAGYAPAPGALIDPYGAPAPPPAYTAAPGWPLWLKIALGVGAAAGVGGLTAALVSRGRSHGARVAGVGCSCQR